MQLTLKKVIKKSRRVRFLSAIAFVLSLASLALYLPDILEFITGETNHMESEFHEYVHIFLCFFLAVISWFCWRAYQVQRQIFSAIDALPHALVLYSHDGDMISANQSGREFMTEFHGKDSVTYSQFIERICLHNLNNKDLLQHINNPLISSIRQPDAIFQDIHKSNSGQIYLIQCQEIAHGMKIVLVTNITQIYDLNKESHTLLTAVNLSPTGFALASFVDNCYRVFYYNNAYQILLGSDQQSDQLSEHIIRLSSFNEWMSIKQSLKNLLPYKLEGRIDEQDENIRWLSCHLFPIRQNEQNMVLIYLSDVTEQKIRDMQSQQSVRLETIGHLSGGIAHDFNNILGIIQGYHNLSIREGVSREKYLEYSNHILNAIQRGSLLSKQLLSFGGNHQIQLKGRTELIPQMKELETLLATLIHGSAKLQFLIPQDMQVCISCPIDIFTQVIMNLVINARDALPNGGTISVLTHIVDANERQHLPDHIRRNEQDYICIQVQDNGTGIKPEHLAHIFDPFFTTKDVNKGTGLGLSLIYRHMKDLNGYIKATSVYGEGTTMSVYLPLLKAVQAEDVVTPVSLNDTDKLKDKIVILADDEADIRFIIRNYLESWGCLVYEAADGNEALSLQDEMEQVDYLLTDIMMPNMSGIHLAHLFGELRPETKTIFITGYPKYTNDNKLNIPENSIALTKPVTEEALQNALLSF